MFCATRAGMAAVLQVGCRGTTAQPTGLAGLDLVGLAGLDLVGLVGLAALGLAALGLDA